MLFQQGYPASVSSHYIQPASVSSKRIHSTANRQPITSQSSASASQSSASKRQPASRSTLVSPHSQSVRETNIQFSDFRFAILANQKIALSGDSLNLYSKSLGLASRSFASA